MTLDSIFMPKPGTVEGKRVTPLGEWPKYTPRPTSDEERLERRRASGRRSYYNHRDQRTAAMRDWYSRQRAA